MDNLQQDIYELINQYFPNNNQLEVLVNGNHLQILIEDESLKNLTIVKQNQAIYKLINSYLSSGTVHAVNIKVI